MDRPEKVTNVITVMCDPSKMKTIAINCRCGKRWTEKIPQELHDSTMTALFECSHCKRQHLLREHKLVSMSKEELHDRSESPFAQVQPSAGVDKGWEYDA